MQVSAVEGALFQVASNFNCCENAATSTNIASGSFVTNLMADTTQGPSAASSTVFSAITRVHAAFYSADEPNTTWGQTRERQIQLLGNEKLAKHFPVKNGKALVDPSEATWTFDLEEQAELLGELKIGLHVGVLAYFARSLIGETLLPRYFVAKKHTPVNINQIFCASLNMHADGVEAASKEVAFSKMNFLLKGAYEGTYLAAELLQSPELYLTCVGGGMFHNPLDAIAEAIANAHLKYLTNQDKKKVEGNGYPRLKKVVLPLFTVGSDPSVFVEAFARVGLPPPKIVRYNR